MKHDISPSRKQWISGHTAIIIGGRWETLMTNFGYVKKDMDQEL